MTTKEIGDFWEKIAEKFLEKKWYEILEKNYRVRGGEIDIIARIDDLYVFVEVRFRKNDDFAHPNETFSRHKIEALSRAIFSYLSENNISEENIRLDFIGIRRNPEDTKKVFISHIEWIEIDFYK